MSNFEERQVIERKYLETQRPYLLEKALLNELFTHRELEDFILKFYTEYKTLKDILDKEYISLINKYEDPGELSKYFIKLLIYSFSDDGARYSYLECIIKKVDNYLGGKKYSMKGKAFREIDIHDIPIFEVISRYSPLPKSLNRNVKCMLHRDKTPSFKIYTKTNSWHCFGCGKGGNAINFIAEMEKCTTKEAFKIFINTYFNKKTNYG